MAQNERTDGTHPNDPPLPRLRDYLKDLEREPRTLELDKKIKAITKQIARIELANAPNQDD